MSTFFCVLLAVFLATTNGLLLGDKKCSWGPSYWCGDLSSARECSAVDHCMSKAWPQHTMIEDESAVCRWCDDLIDDIRELAMNGTSKANISGCLKDACKRIPDQRSRHQCYSVITSNLTEVLQMIRGNAIADRVICKTIGFCSAEQRPVANVPRDSGANKCGNQNRDYCRDCERFFEDAKELYLGNYTEQEFKDMLLQQCDSAGYEALVQMCKTVITEYWPQIYARLEMFFDPDKICYQLTFCNSTVNARRMESMPMVKIGPSMKSAAKVSQATQTEPLPLNRMLLDVGAPFASFGVQRSTTKKAKSVTSNVQCVLCEYVMSYVDKMLADNYTEASIQAAMDRVCHLMPSTVRDSCTAFVDEYSGAILIILSGEMDPKAVCSSLNLCQQKLEVAVSCDSCKEVLQMMKTLLEDYEESTRIINMVKGFCDNFPDPAKAQCRRVVAAYMPYLLQIAAQMLSPEGVCKAFKMCPAIAPVPAPVSSI